VLVDDHPAVRHGVRQLISSQDDLVTIAEAGRASQATADLAQWAEVADRGAAWHLPSRAGRAPPPDRPGIAPIAASVGTPDSGRSPLDCERAGRRLRSSGG